MPSNLPSSFASAAAGQNAQRGGRGGSGSDWARRDGRSANGTLTLRRSSTTPLSHASQAPAPNDLVQSPGLEPQSTQSSVYELEPQKYSREELLAMSQNRRAADVSRLYEPGWNPHHINGGSSRAWGKSNENHVPQEPGACWNENGDTVPMGLTQMSAEERELFSGDINSPLKPPTMNKDGGNAAAVNGRKASLSHGTSNAFPNSPSSATRPGPRRRETTEANPIGVNSPTAGRRDDSSPWFTRKTGETKEPEAEEHEAESGRDPSSKLPFSLSRSNTAGSTGMGNIWPSSNPGTPGAGAFGSFNLGGSGSSAAIGDKRAGGAAGGSRLAHLIPRDSAEAAPGRQPEGPNPLNQSSWRSRQRTDTDPFGDDGPSGSAALGGAQDDAAPSQPSRAGTLGTPVKGAAGDFGMSGLQLGDEDTGSPSGTNPYRSPPAERHEGGESEQGAPRGFNMPFGQESAGMNPLRGFPGAPEGHDRSQTSSVGAKGFPMGHMSAWGAPGGPSTGTPDRERANFGAGPFSPGVFGGLGGSEVQSPGLGDMSSFYAPGSAGGIGNASIGRGSKISSLFPASMQAQMQQAHEQHEGLGDSAADLRQANPLGAIGRNFNMPARNESPMRSNRGVFGELFPSSDASRSQGPFGSGDPSQPGSVGTPTQPFTPGSGGMGFMGGEPAAAEPPVQARTMVMPDRMRWVYLDPQGKIQGPFTGLEMNDWYKAHFFSPDLRVKKVEDVDFEPLGQLIRRIGNSREPFLVPQVGVAHGEPSGGATAPGFPTNAPGGVIPPLSGVFPSFGRTLTAEEQNNLERRKQEEQYLMAHQREIAMRQNMQRFPGQQQGLQHHSSAQSLQSQPSFGSITSPMGAQGQGPHPPVGGFPSGGPPGNFMEMGGQGPQARAGGMMEPGFGDQDPSTLNQTEREVITALHSGQHPQQILAALEEHGLESDIRSGLPQPEELAEDAEGFRERLHEFNRLRAEHEASEAARLGHGVADEPEAEDEPIPQEAPVQKNEPVSSPQRKTKGKQQETDESGLSLTEQVQQTQAAAVAAAHISTEPDMPMPFPPPSSSTPLPAPTAQRARSNLPDQYNRSRSGSLEDEQAGPAQPPPLAPWAKEASGDAPKGPSLKEIQEAEARKAAKAEQAAAAQRKAVLEQEAAQLREKEKQAAAVAAGLPASSTWGHASPVSAGSPWTKPGAPKAPAPGISSPATSSKKTLAEIQREEESRKQKVREAAIQSGMPATSTSKSYANLAGKPGQAPIPSGASPAAAPVAPAAGWATVGAGGKVKIPTGPAAQTRSASTTSVKPAAAPVKPMSRPGPAAIASNGTSSNTAMDDFRKWAQRELVRGGINVNDIDTFLSTLEALPLDKGIISDAIYGNSSVMDGRHFAEEYVRRKTLAEKGVAEKPPSGAAAAKAGGSTGGWNEVAKKSSAAPAGGAKDEAIGFHVVAAKKKGKK